METMNDSKEEWLENRKDHDTRVDHDSTDVEDDWKFLRPFEWLTSPASLIPLLGTILMQQQQCHNNNNTNNIRGSRVLHLGSGSSILGECILEMFPSMVSQIVNVDKDEATLRKMQSRWNKQQQQQQQHGQSNHCSDGLSSSVGDHSCRCCGREWVDERSEDDNHKLVFETVDFVRDKIPYPDGSFDLIVDKGTLDCTLCSDKGAAWQLREVHRLLKPHGGTYVVISLHPLDLLLPLLQQCPGTTDWTISYMTLFRQVEDLTALITNNKNSSSNQVGLASCFNNPRRQDSFHISPDNSGTESPGAYPTFNFSPLAMVGDEKFDTTRMVNVLVATRQGNVSVSSLDVDAIYDHIHQTTDDWFQKKNPLLDATRSSHIRQAFAEQGGRVNLTQSYDILFTSEERDLLTLDDFLQDWNAFVQQQQQPQPQRDLGASKSEQDAEQYLTLEAALAFLEEMQ